MKHKADGLYYFDKRMFEKRSACDNGKENFFDAFGDTVVITHNNVMKALKASVNVYWAADAMLMRGKVTWDEFAVFDFADTFGNTRSVVAKGFMDMIALRAEREGLL